MAFYCVTKSREPTTNESDVLSAFVCTLFVSVNDSCCEYFLINVKLSFRRFLHTEKIDEDYFLFYY